MNIAIEGGETMKRSCAMVVLFSHLGCIHVRAIRQQEAHALSVPSLTSMVQRVTLCTRSIG